MPLVSQSGPARFAKIKEAEAIFWSDWGHDYEIDLTIFVEEFLDYLLSTYPKLLSYQFTPLNFSRSRDDSLLVKCLESRWPNISERVRHKRAYNVSTEKLWLPMIVEHRLLLDPNPFIYIVDSYLDLSENHYWLQSRLETVKEEVIMDLSGIVMTTSEFLKGLGEIA